MGAQTVVALEAIVAKHITSGCFLPLEYAAGRVKDARPKAGRYADWQ
jgi:hypothetical protein